MSGERRMSAEERQLADLLKRVVPEPPRQLTYEEITVRNVDRTVKSWLAPALAAASILIIGGAVGAVAATNSGQAPPAAPAANQSSSPASGRPTSPGCQPTAEPTSTTARGGSVVLPSVVGRQQMAAVAGIEQAGLIVIVREAASKTIPEGLVVAQAPAPGAHLSPGATVTLTVSAGAGGARPTASAVPAPTASAAPTPSPSATCLTPGPVASPTGGPSPAPTGAPVAVPSAAPTGAAPAGTAGPATAPTAGTTVPSAEPTTTRPEGTAGPTTAPTPSAARG
jgi:hypothetical protein